MDIATVLEEYLADVAPLPADLAFILDEIRVKDQKLLEAQRRIQQRDGPIQRHVKTSGALAEYPKEQAAYPRIRSDFQECLLLQKEKARLATMGLFLMSKHVSKLDRQVAQLEAEGVLAPAVLTPEEPSVYQSDPEPAPRPRKTSMAERRASRPEPRRSQASRPRCRRQPAGTRRRQQTQRGPQLSATTRSPGATPSKLTACASP